jgi:hypothetical protein
MPRLIGPRWWEVVSVSYIVVVQAAVSAVLVTNKRVGTPAAAMCIRIAEGASQSPLTQPVGTGKELVHATGKPSCHSGLSASIFGFFVFHRTTHHWTDPSTPPKFQMFQSPSQLLKESSALVLSKLPAHKFSLIKVGAAPAIHAVASIVGSKLNACS